MADPITRDEFTELLNRVKSLESKTDVLVVQGAVANANAKSIVWRLVAMTLMGFIVGVAPYVMHLAGALK